jgi:hypothetical protein
LKKVLELFNNDKERIVIVNGGRWFLTGFIPFQYGMVLNPNNRLHASILLLLEKNGVKLTSIRPQIEVKDRVKDKDKDKDKDISILCVKDLKERSVRKTKTRKFSYKSFPEADNPEFKNYLQSVYPQTNVEVEFRRMESWLLTHPRNIYKNYGSFCRGWIDRTSKQSGFLGREEGREPTEPEITYEQPPMEYSEEERKKAQEKLAEMVKKVAEVKKL